MRAMMIGGLGILCAACGIYQSNWDCPPGQGIGCKPVTEVLDMIVEQEGEDLFITDPCAREQMRAKQPAPERPDQKLYLLKERSGGDAVIVEGT